MKLEMNVIVNCEGAKRINWLTVTDPSSAFGSDVWRVGYHARVPGRSQSNFSAEPAKSPGLRL
jgi:hypothetical protein